MMNFNDNYEAANAAIKEMHMKGVKIKGNQVFMTDHKERIRVMPEKLNTFFNTKDVFSAVCEFIRDIRDEAPVDPNKWTYHLFGFGLEAKTDDPSELAKGIASLITVQNRKTLDQIDRELEKEGKVIKS